MKKIKIVINLTIIITWILLFLLIKNYFKITNLADLINLIKYHPKTSTIIFLILSTTRIFTFLPGAIFMIIGGMIFDPVKSFLLTLISITISETIIFIISKNFCNGGLIEKITAKYPKIIDIAKEYNNKFLVLGILCPVAPTDLVCFISSYAGLKYKNFILTVILSNIPIIIVYNILGQSFLYSIYYFLFIACTFLGISIYLVQIWSKITKAV